MPIQSYRDLRVWQEAMRLNKEVAKLTLTYPKQELYILVSQTRRSALSIPCNIAEGQSRYTSKDFRHFLVIARGSLAELVTQILVAIDLGYLTSEAAQDVLTLTEDVGKMLNGLIKKLDDQPIRVA